MSTTLYVLNAFSLSMLDRETQRGTPPGYVPHTGDAIGQTARIPRPVEDPIDLLAAYQDAGIEIISAVDHADIAAVFSSVLETDISVSHVGVKLTPDNVGLVGQYVGPRLPEGATELPEGATIEWWVV